MSRRLALLFQTLSLLGLEIGCATASSPTQTYNSSTTNRHRGSLRPLFLFDSVKPV